MNILIKAVEDYICEVARLAKSGITTEHTFRGALAMLLDALAPNLKAFNEPKRTECGAPDYIVQDKTGLGVFYVEAKDLGDDDLGGKKRTGHKEQFDRYKAALDTIIFTDYLDFHLYRHGEFVSSVKIADYDGAGKVSGNSGAYEKLAELIKEASLSTPQKIDSSKRLAELMAGKARLLQRNSAKFLAPLTKAYDDAPSHAKPPKKPILDLLIGMREVLMPNVGADEFSDIFAQTLTYGMFAARLNDPTPESFTRYEAMGLIPKTNPFLRQFFQYVANNLEEELEWMVDDLADLFRAADVEKIMRGYGRTGADPMIHFYEDFLAEYDAGLRKDRGVWYTPIQVVKFIVGAADWALRKRFNLVDGLADRGKVEIECEEVAPHGKKMTQKVKKSVHRVQLLDPATGTGTFIAESIRQIFAKFKGNEGLWPGYVESDLLPRLNGFELLMASYTMAHIKIDFALRETLGKREEGSGKREEFKQRFNVFLTDSLSPWHKELPGGLFASALAPEQKGADEVKRDTPVMVVLGNPPYNVSSTNKSDWIQNLVADYKKNLNERKINLDDDYIKFIRLGQHYVDKNEEGIIAYITNNSYLDGITHRQMRKSLMESFDEIYVLNLHGNARKKEVAPDGGKDENVFNIMQGVAITLFVKCKGSTGLTRLTGLKDETKNLVNPVNPVKNNCRVYYADLWGKKKEKLAALDDATMESIKWKELKLTEPYYFFVPKDFALEDEYNEGFSVSELFSVNNSGIQTKRDKVVYSYEVRDIKMVVSDFAKCSEMEIRQRYALPADGRDWTVAWAKDDVSKGGGQFVNVHYHPFDKRWTYFTGHTSGFMAYPRMPASGHMLCDNVALLAVRNSRGDLANNYFVADTIVDKDGVSSLDNCRFFPLYLYEENMGKVEKKANLDKDIVAKIAAILNPVNPVNPVKESPTPEDIFDYIYGVLHSPAYRTKFKEFLKVDFPRIPYPKDLGEFERFRAAGRELRAVHLMKDAEPSLSEARGRFPIAGDNVVDTVRFEIIGDNFNTETKPLSESQCLCASVLKKSGRVYINSSQYFDNVPLEAWGQAIGGYRPAEKYLKDRKNRALSQEELKHYQRIILALAKTREIMDAL